MIESNIDVIYVGERQYAVELLNPLDGIELGGRALTLFGPFLGKLLAGGNLEALAALNFEKVDPENGGPELRALLGTMLQACGDLGGRAATDMLVEVIRRCYTPENEPLDDAAAFNNWFKRYPGDMFPLGFAALRRLVRDFFTSPLVTATSGLLTTTPGTAPR